jgi:alpha-galactosidase
MKHAATLFILLQISLIAPCQMKEDMISRYESSILTPEDSPQPKINGATIFGVRPGKPVLFTIPCTGKRPITFSAKNLPDGLILDSKTGRFSGSIKVPGTYHLLLSAKNEVGNTEREFRIVVGDKIALTPPMGWNSWNGWGNLVTQENVKASAEAMVKTDLINHGWSYINVDIGWEGIRGGRFNAVQPNDRFPDMKGLCDYIHSLGLKAGIYSTPWVKTYRNGNGGSSDSQDGHLEDSPVENLKDKGHYIGKYLFTKNDVKQWEAWGFDYLKYDWGEPTDKPNPENYAKIMSEELRNCSRDIVFSLCHPFSSMVERAPSELPYVQLFRTGQDIRDVWDNSMLEQNEQWPWGIKDIWDIHREWRPFTKPGNWADPDMLAVGWVGFGNKILHPARLTPDEQYTHISLWCLWSAPLIFGSPVEKLDKFTISLLSNDEVLEINQDPLGHQAYLAQKNGKGETWMKNMEDGSLAVGLFNLSTEEITVHAEWVKLGIYGKYRLRDAWRQKDLGVFEKQFSTKVPAHGVLLIRMFPVK